MIAEIHPCSIWLSKRRKFKIGEGEPSSLGYLTNPLLCIDWETDLLLQKKIPLGMENVRGSMVIDSLLLYHFQINEKQFSHFKMQGGHISQCYGYFDGNLLVRGGSPEGIFLIDLSLKH